MTLGSGQSSLQVAAVQPHRTLQHTWLVWPSLPGPQLSPVSRALTLLESTYFLGEGGARWSVQPEVGGQGFRQEAEPLAAQRARTGRADAGLPPTEEGERVGECRASLTVSCPGPSQLPAAAPAARVGVWVIRAWPCARHTA